MTIVCSNKSCKYRKAVFCGSPFVGINQFGQCLVWFDRNGNRRAVPDYRYEVAQKQHDVKEKKETSPSDSKESAEESKNPELETEKSEDNNEARE